LGAREQIGGRTAEQFPHLGNYTLTAATRHTPPTDYGLRHRANCMRCSTNAAVTVKLLLLNYQLGLQAGKDYKTAGGGPSGINRLAGFRSRT